MARAATLTLGAAIWILAAVLLWRTKVPADLELPSIDERSLFGAGVLDEANRYQRFFYIEFLMATVAGIVAFVLMVRRGTRIARSLQLGPVNAGIILGAVTLTVVWAVSLPFALATEWWQRRYGISTQSYADALFAAWGELLVGVLAGFIILACFLGFAKRLGVRWWLAAAPLLLALAVVLQLVIPYALSIDTHPLRDRELAAAIERLEDREDAGDPAVLEQDVSDETTAANAFAVGIGPAERIVFFSTLLDGRFSADEVRFVAAHELAHLARDHIVRGLGWFLILVVPMLAAAAYITERRGGLRDPANVPLVLLVIVVAQLVVLPLQNAVSRRYETEADWIALEATRDPAAARGLFREFAFTSLDDPSPPWLAHVVLDTHPTVLDRIELAAAWRERSR